MTPRASGPPVPSGAVPGRRRLRVAVLAVALTAGLVPFAERAGAEDAPPAAIDEGPAPVNLLDDSFLPPGFPGANENLEGLQFDPERARELLAQSRYGGADGMRS